MTGAAVLGAPPAAIAVAKSGDTKLGRGRMHATYATRESCDQGCPLWAACYAAPGAGRVGFTTIRLDRAAAGGLRPVDVARQEARAIARLVPDRDLRVHVVGDCRTPAAARIVGVAMRDYDRRARDLWIARGRVGPCPRSFTYTHSWRAVPREDWGDASVIASCETVADVRRAYARGYTAAAIVVPEHPADGRAYPLEPVAGLPATRSFYPRSMVIHCPNQTRGVVCADCRLGIDPPPGRIIGFAAHGNRKGLLNSA